MFAEERLQQIVSLLKDSRRVQAEELAGSLNVSRETIRRDLKRLEADGVIRRVHGGALLAQPSQEAPFRSRVERNIAEKRLIAKAAAQLIYPGCCCFIDAGSTTAALARELADIGDISIITNSLDVATILRSSKRKSDIVLLGGGIGYDVPATHGELTLDQIRLFRADIAFISPVGLDRDAGITYFHLAEAEIAKAMLARAGKKVLLADSSKHGVVSRALVAECKDIHILVTDAIVQSELGDGAIGEVLIA